MSYRGVIIVLVGFLALVAIGCAAANPEPAYVDQVKSILADQEQSEADILDLRTESTQHTDAAKTPDWVTRHDHALHQLDNIAQRIQALTPPPRFGDANVVLVLMAQDDEAYVQAARAEFDPAADSLTRQAATTRATQALSQLIAAETQARQAVEALGVILPTRVPAPP